MRAIIRALVFGRAAPMRVNLVVQVPRGDNAAMPPSLDSEMQAANGGLHGLVEEQNVLLRVSRVRR